MKYLQLEIDFKNDTKKEKNRKYERVFRKIIETNPNVPQFSDWFYEVNKERILWKDQPLTRKKGWARYKILVLNGFWD
tara:strand:+ start:211 stop:444 length:234 start_codon:yes stop_codon:yes gene_type:complete